MTQIRERIYGWCFRYRYDARPHPKWLRKLADFVWRRLP